MYTCCSFLFSIVMAYFYAIQTLEISKIPIENHCLTVPNIFEA